MLIYLLTLCKAKVALTPHTEFGILSFSQRSAFLPAFGIHQLQQEGRNQSFWRKKAANRKLLVLFSAGIPIFRGVISHAGLFYKNYQRKINDSRHNRVHFTEKPVLERKTTVFFFFQFRSHINKGCSAKLHTRVIPHISKIVENPISPRRSDRREAALPSGGAGFRFLLFPFLPISYFLNLAVVLMHICRNVRNQSS